MANSRIAKFVTEVAPPQFINVARRRRSKVLDTIREEDRDFSSEASCSSLKSSLALQGATASSSSSSAASANASSMYFLQGVQRSFSIFEN